MTASISRVLLMIDEPIVYLDIQRILKANNYSIVEKNKTKDVSLLCEPPPDIIIVSYSLLRKKPELIGEFSKLKSRICILSDQPAVTFPDPNELKYISLIEPFSASELLQSLITLQGN